MSTTLKRVENALSVYTLEEIIEINELTEEEVLEFLLDQKFIRLPSVMPIDLEDD